MNSFKSKSNGLDSPVSPLGLDDALELKNRPIYIQARKDANINAIDINDSLARFIKQHNIPQFQTKNHPLNGIKGNTKVPTFLVPDCSILANVSKLVKTCLEDPDAKYIPLMMTDINISLFLAYCFMHDAQEFSLLVPSKPLVSSELQSIFVMPSDPNGDEKSKDIEKVGNVKSPRSPMDSKDSKDVKDVKDSKNVKDSNDAKQPTISEQIFRTSDNKFIEFVKLLGTYEKTSLTAPLHSFINSSAKEKTQVETKLNQYKASSLHGTYKLKYYSRSCLYSFQNDVNYLDCPHLLKLLNAAIASSMKGRPITVLQTLVDKPDVEILLADFFRLDVTDPDHVYSWPQTLYYLRQEQRRVDYKQDVDKNNDEDVDQADEADEFEDEENGKAEGEGEDDENDEDE